MHAMIRKLLFGAILAGFAGSCGLQATWYEQWIWFSKAGSEEAISDSQSNAPAKNINYWGDTKELSKGLLPTALCVWALFFMPDSVKNGMSKNLLMLLNDPKVVAPLWFAAGCHLAWRIAKVKNDILSAKNVLDVGGKVVENGISGALSNDKTKGDVKDVLKAAVLEFFREQPTLVASLFSKLNLVKIGGGSDEDETAEKVAAILGPKLDVAVKTSSDHKDELVAQYKEILKRLDENKPLRVLMYQDLKKGVSGLKNYLARHFENNDFDIYGSGFGGPYEVALWCKSDGAIVPSPTTNVEDNSLQVSQDKNKKE